jgi:hypothetical protein
MHRPDFVDRVVDSNPLDRDAATSSDPRHRRPTRREWPRTAIPLVISLIVIALLIVLL